MVFKISNPTKVVYAILMVFEISNSVGLSSIVACASDSFKDGKLQVPQQCS